MLYGNHVIIDHGIIDDVGHVVSIYAHLDALDPAIGIGRPVEAGQLLGWVGNSGTNTAAGALDWSLHLHWELHVDDHYLGAGLSATETRARLRDPLRRIGRTAQRPQHLAPTSRDDANTSSSRSGDPAGPHDHRTVHHSPIARARRPGHLTAQHLHDRLTPLVCSRAVSGS